MERRIPWLWIGVAAALLLLPSGAGRLLLDVIGGLTLTLLLLPLLIGGAVFIGWQILRRRLRTCPSCGMASVGLEVCPACGGSLTQEASDAPWADGSSTTRPFWPYGEPAEIDARDVTITVDAVDVESGGNPETHPSGGSSG
jgi:hypothetical protein